MTVYTRYAPSLIPRPASSLFRDALFLVSTPEFEPLNLSA
jgi:hypothetical protein